MDFKIKPRDKKKLKSSRVRRYFKEVEKIVNEKLAGENFDSKLFDAIARGYPIRITKDGHVKVMKGRRYQ